MRFIGNGAVFHVAADTPNCAVATLTLKGTPQDPAVTAEALDPGVKKARVFTFPLSLATGQTSSTNQRCPSNICYLILEV